MKNGVKKRKTTIWANHTVVLLCTPHPVRVIFSYCSIFFRVGREVAPVLA